MSDSVTISIEFDFKGESYQPSLRIDVEELLKKSQEEAGFYDLLAHTIGIDAYRYEYDVMVMEEIVFSNPTGLIAEHMRDGRPDIEALNSAWQDIQNLHKLAAIANEMMGISNLDQQPQLKAALQAAFKAGAANVPNNTIRLFSF